MNLKQKSAKDRVLNVSERVVLVAVKFSLDIQRNALIWALTHVAQPGDCVKLLVVLSPHSSSKKWNFPRFHSDCAVGHGHGHGILGTSLDQKDYITDSCTQMMLELHQYYDPDTIKVKVKIVSGSQHGVVAAEAKRSQTHWVILDKGVKKEAKCCMDQLDCNVVVMKKSRPKVLRLNLIGTPSTGSVERSGSESYQMHVEKDSARWNAIQVPNVTPVSSPEHTSFTGTDAGTSSISSLDPGSSPKFISELDWNLMKGRFSYQKENCNYVESDSDTDSEKLGSPSTSVTSHQWVADILSSAHEYSKYFKKESQGFNRMLNPMFESLDRKISVPDLEAEVGVLKYRLEDIDMGPNVRDVVSLTTKSPCDPFPLCSVCQHKAPVFGKPPRWFAYAELEHATGGFSQANFLAEGGYGSVHRGVLPDGQVIAVKQHKSASSQGDREFCSEVEVLSCAQHRNVVMLIGFCVEGGRRLLVYEYICNGSLDAHLYGRKPNTLDWSARQKIATGAARGLRYLHEECRVGCIIHRDLRPNNILLTHDFEPLVGDFGLARWQPDGETGFETRIIGTFGYMSPEYAQSGQITEKADVYAFGVVLIELVTGRKAVDINRPKGQQYLTVWARPLLEESAIAELIDPLLNNCYSEQEVKRMLGCASLCIRRDPHSRPRMSQVLRMMEGDSF